MYYNDEVFQTQEYNADSIKYESKLAFTPVKINWMTGGSKLDFKLQTSLLNDETDLF